MMIMKPPADLQCADVRLKERSKSFALADLQCADFSLKDRGKSLCEARSPTDWPT
jgi:hypothetical protein